MVIANLVKTDGSRERAKCRRIFAIFGTGRPFPSNPLGRRLAVLKGKAEEARLKGRQVGHSSEQDVPTHARVVFTAPSLSPFDNLTIHHLDSTISLISP